MESFKDIFKKIFAKIRRHFVDILKTFGIKKIFCKYSEFTLYLRHD